MAKAKKPRKLKVFRTPAGFNDAYVAAPSQKAALEAWGSDADLFARGVAEVVTDEKLMAAPLANPGMVVKLSRGTAAEQVAEAGKQAKQPAKAKGGSDDIAAPVKPKKKAGPRPSRRALDQATDAIAEAETRQRQAEEAIAQKIADLNRQRDELTRSHREGMEQLERKRDKARAAYDKALAKWEP